MGHDAVHFDTSNDNWFFEGDALIIATDEFNEIFGNSAYPAICRSRRCICTEHPADDSGTGEEMLDRVPLPMRSIH